MTAPLQNDAAWILIERVRDRAYDFFTVPEKRRLHDLVVKFKRSRSVALDDLKWLSEMDANLRAMGARPAIPVPRFAKRRKGVRV